jgi:hypothetical protein
MNCMPPAARSFERRYPAEHCVIVDDKLRILNAIKQRWDRRATTVFLRPGDYAADVDTLETYSLPTSQSTASTNSSLVEVGVLPDR